MQSYPIHSMSFPSNAPDSYPLEKLLFVSKAVLQQAIDLLENRLNSDDQFTTYSRYLSGSTIGKHVRHALDHFQLLLNVMATPPPRSFSYDTRARNTPMETSKNAAKESIFDTIKQLERLVPGANLNDPMTLQAVTPFMQEFQTTFGRELWFAVLHCVHHWSMIRVIAGELGITLSDDFGFAPSTLLYQGREAPLGKAKI